MSIYVGKRTVGKRLEVLKDYFKEEEIEHMYVILGAFDLSRKLGMFQPLRAPEVTTFFREYFGICNWPAKSVRALENDYRNILAPRRYVCVEERALTETVALSKFWQHSRDYWYYMNYQPVEQQGDR